MTFEEAVDGLMAGDFSRLEPLFVASADHPQSAIIEWHDAGRFVDQPLALAEAFTCAAFNGCVEAMTYLLAAGVHPDGGINTGLNAFHWAANRGQVAAVDILIQHGASLEVRNSYGGTVLGSTVWSAIHEYRPNHYQIIEMLLRAGANVHQADFPSGNATIDALLSQYGSSQ